MRGLLLLIVLAGGCFDPTPAALIPCSESGRCPSGQRCDPDTHLCNGTSVDGGAGDDDAAAGDGPDAPTGPCGMYEDLVNGACVVRIEPIGPTVLGPTGCSTGATTIWRAVALDQTNKIYAAFRCGAGDEARVMVSADSARTASMSHSFGMNIDTVAVAGGPPGVAYLGTAGQAGIGFSVTVDGGATWSATTMLATTPPNPDFGVVVRAYGNSVYVAAELPGGIRVWRNANRGSGAFASTDVSLPHVYGDMIVDPSTGHVYVTGDDPNLHMKKSTDGGATFGAQIDPPGMFMFSDWGVGGSSIYAVGAAQTSFTKIPIANPTGATTTNAGFPAARNLGRGLSVGADEALYVTTHASGNNTLTITRVAPGASTGTSKTIGTGSGPSVTAGPGTNAIYVFEDTANQMQFGVVGF